MELFKNILRIAFWVLLVAGLITVFAFVQDKEDKTLWSIFGGGAPTSNTMWLGHADNNCSR